MTATNRKDVLLVIRAREEAARAVNAATDALERLLDVQGNVGDSAALTGSKLAGLVAAINSVERANTSVSASWSKAEGAYQRQQSALAETRAQLTSVKGQIEAVGTAIEAAQRRIVDANLAGDDTGPFIAQIRGAKAALSDLEGQERKLTSTLRTQENALGESRNSLMQLGSVANAVEAALIGVGDAGERAALEQRAAAQAATEQYRLEAAAIREVVELEQRLGVRRSSATAGGATFSALNDRERDAEAAQRLRDRLDPLAGVHRRINAELAEAKRLMDSGAISAHEFAQEEARLANEARQAADALHRQGRGERGKPSMFGLKPYELTNLGYQINDVITQLASGTSLTQTLAQQGGQIIQLFPRIGDSIISAFRSPVILAAAAAITTVVLAMRKAGEEAERLRFFEGVLRSIGDGANYSSRELAESARLLQRMGVAADDANRSLGTFVREGVNPAFINQFGQAARNMADVMGIEVTDAARQVGEAFTGNFQAIQRLQEATGFLTAEQERNIRTMFEEGRAGAARNQALEIFTQRMSNAAQQSRGPWTQAGRSLSRMWEGLLAILANTAPIRLAVGAMNLLADAINGVARAIGALPAEEAATRVMPSVEQIEALLNRLRTARNTAAQLGRDTAFLDRQIQEAEQGLLRARGELDPRDPRSTAAQQEREQIDRDRLHQLSVIQLQAEYDRLIEIDRRWGEVRAENNRVAIQGEIAYREALQATSSASRAAAAREVAETRERTRIRADQRGSMDSNIQRYVRRTIAVESSGDPNARPRNRDGSLASSALGVGQFLESTWLRMFRQYFPDQANGMSARAILELRRNQRVSERLIELYARENAQHLQEAGQAVTQFNLYLAHYLGPRGAVNVLRARPDTPIVEAIAGGGPGSRGYRQAQQAVAANGELRRGATAGGALAAIRRRVGRQFGDGGAESDARQDVLEAINQQEAQRAVQQEAFNRRIDDENDVRARSVTQARALLNLAGDRNLAEQRTHAIENAVDEARREAARQGLEIDDTRLARIRETVAAEWDVVHARERATRAIDEASAERQALIERMTAAREAGDGNLADQLQAQIGEIDARLRQAIQSAIAFWQQFNTPEARTAITGLRSLNESLGRSETQFRQQAAQRPVDLLTAQRDSLREQIDFFQREGRTDVVRELRAQLQLLDRDLQGAIDRIIEFYRTSNLPDAQAMVAHWQNVRNQIAATQDQFRVTAGDVQEAFAGSLTSSAQQWAQALGEGRNVLRATWDALRGFAADFIQKIAMMILQAAALKLAMKIGFGNIAGGINGILNVAPIMTASVTLAGAGTTLTTAGVGLTASAAAWAATAAAIMAAAAALAASGGAGGAASGLLSAFASVGPGLFHSGGIAGAANITRRVSPALFHYAARYHTGGLAGLAPDEVPAILRRNEEILTENDPRHRFNGGLAGSGMVEPKVDLAVINAIDAGDFVSKGLNTRPGQRAFLNFVRANAGAVNQALGGQG